MRIILNLANKKDILVSVSRLHSRPILKKDKKNDDPTLRDNMPFLRPGVTQRLHSAPRSSFEYLNRGGYGVDAAANAQHGQRTGTASPSAPPPVGPGSAS